MPAYAMKGYKYQSHIGAEIRKVHLEMKTKVAILRGDTLPSIKIRKRTKSKYYDVLDDMLTTARAEVMRKAKAEADRRKRDREERELLGDQPIDIGPATGKLK